MFNPIDPDSLNQPPPRPLLSHLPPVSASTRRPLSTARLPATADRSPPTTAQAVQAGVASKVEARGGSAMTAVAIDTRWREVLSGCVSGVAATFVGMPFDNIKVRLQHGKTSAKRGAASAGARPMHTLTAASSSHATSGGAWVNAARAYEQHGLLGFFRGGLVPVAMRAPITGSAFALQTSYTSLIKDVVGVEQCSIPQVSLAAAMTGVSLTPLIAVSERIKVQMQVAQMSGSRKNTSAWATSVRIYKAGTNGRYGGYGVFGGMRSLFFGSSITALRLIPGWGAYFGTYEYLTRIIHKETELGHNDLMSTNGKLLVMAAGASAGCVSWVLSLPFDVVKTSMQGQPLHNPRVANPLKAAIRIYRNGAALGVPGYRMFLSGMGPAIARSVPVNAVNFYLFEQVYQMLTARDDRRRAR